MMVKLDDKLGIGLAAGLITLISLAFAAIAWWTQDPEYLNRGGATILILAALSVVWQVTRERRAEAHAHHHQEVAGDHAAAFEPVSSVTQRIATLSRNVATTEYLAVRRMYVWFVASVTAYGELLHGWGDVIMKAFGVHEGG